MSRPALVLAALILLLATSQAQAAEPVPGDACGTNGVVQNTWQWAGGKENGGVYNGMFCNGSTYAGIINFQSTGSLNIGTTTAQSGYALNVNGAIYANNIMSIDNNADYMGYYVGSAGSVQGYLVWRNALSRLEIDTQSLSYPIFLDGSTVALQSQSGGKVGIGTASPATDLEIYANSNSFHDMLIENDSSSGYLGDIAYQLKTRSSYFEFMANDETNSASIADLAAGTNPIVIDGTTDYVGIGTSVPSFPLDIYSNVNGGSQIGIDNPNTGTGAFSQLSLSNDTLNSNGYLALASSTYGTASIANVFNLATNSATKGILISTGGSTPTTYPIEFAPGGTEIARFTTIGLGIGTTTPQALLDVNGYARLKKYSAAPVACSATYDGAVALTHVYTLCLCKGGSSAWVQSKDGSTACSW